MYLTPIAINFEFPYGGTIYIIQDFISMFSKLWLSLIMDMTQSFFNYISIIFLIIHIINKKYFIFWCPGNLCFDMTQHDPYHVICHVSNIFYIYIYTYFWTTVITYWEDFHNFTNDMIIHIIYNKYIFIINILQG